MAINNAQFVFGTHIYRSPSLPLQELKRDMHTLKELGFNTIKIQESWAIDERREGEIDLSDVEELIAEAGQIGMGVYFGVTMEQTPMWVWRKYPDCRLVNALGEPHEDPTQYLLPADGKPGPCWDHPGVRREAERFLSTLAEELGRYDNIIVWNVWQEIGFWPPRPGATTLAEKSYCYCSYTLVRFRDWLKGKYKSLEALNAAWRTGFGSWDEVEPSRMFAMVPSWIDWRYFMDVIYLADVVKWRADLLRRNDPLHRPAMAHVGAPTIGSGRDWAYAKSLEVFGTSFYPGWITLTPWDYGYPREGAPLTKEVCLRHELFRSSLHFDYARSATGQREFWAAEFQGGPISQGIFRGPVPTSEDIRRWLMIALSAGVQGICFWNHRPEIFWSEMHGFGLCKWDGTPTARAEEAGRIGKALNRHRELFKRGCPPQAQVAIIVNEDLYHFAEATPDALKHLQHTIKGWYQCLWEEGIWLDFVEAGEVLQSHLKPYKVAILPFPIALGKDLAESLKSYVSDGGILISEACPGRVDQYGMANLPGMAKAMRELFGAEHEGLSLCGEWGRPKWSPPRERYEILPPTELQGEGAYRGHRLRASFYLETYRPKGGAPILSCEKGIAGVLNEYCDGKAILLGTFVGHAAATYDHAQSRAFLLKLIRDAGVRPERYDSLLRHRRIWKDEEAWFLINPSDREVTERVEVGGFAQVEDLLEGKNVPIEGKSVSIAVRPFSIRCLVLSKERGDTEGRLP